MGGFRGSDDGTSLIPEDPELTMKVAMVLAVLRSRYGQMHDEYVSSRI